MFRKTNLKRSRWSQDSSWLRTWAYTSNACRTLKTWKVTLHLTPNVIKNTNGYIYWYKDRYVADSSCLWYRKCMLRLWKRHELGSITELVICLTSLTLTKKWTRSDQNAINSRRKSPLQRPNQFHQHFHPTFMEINQLVLSKHLSLDQKHLKKCI